MSVSIADADEGIAREHAARQFFAEHSIEVPVEWD